MGLVSPNVLTMGSALEECVSRNDPMIFRFCHIDPRSGGPKALHAPHVCTCALADSPVNMAVFRLYDRLFGGDGEVPEWGRSLFRGTMGDVERTTPNAITKNGGISAWVAEIQKLKDFK